MKKTTSHEHTPPHLWLGVLLSLLAYFFFVVVSTIVWQKEKNLSTAQVLFFQNGISLLLTLPIAFRYGIKKMKSRYLNYHMMRDLFGICSYFFYFLAIQNLNLSDATTLNYSAPFFVPIIWWIWTKQKVGHHVWWSIILGFLGVAIILNPSKEIGQLGFIYGVFAGISSAIAFCALRILNLHQESMGKVLFYYFSLGTLLSFPFAWITWEPPSFIGYMQLISIGIGTFIAQILLTIAYRFGTASYLSPLGYSSVIYAGLSSFLLFNTPLSLRSFIGTFLIVLGGTLTYLLKKHPKSLAKTFENPDVK